MLKNKSPFPIFILFSYFLHISSCNPLCEIKSWVLPVGDNFNNFENIRTVEDCCTRCNQTEPCSAYSYNIMSQTCWLWNHTTFENTSEFKILSGIVFPPGFVTEIVPSTTVSVPRCDPDNNDPTVKFPHTLDCSMYFVCLNGNEYLESCWGGGTTPRLFDYLESDCKHFEDAICYPGATSPTMPSNSTTPMTTTTTSTTMNPITVSTTPIPMECPPSGIENIPHPDDCTKYIRCVNGDATVITCPNGNHFDVVSRQCMDPNVAQCFVPTTNGTTQLPPITTQTPSTSTTTRGPTVSTTTLAPGICPPSGIVNIPHLYDCTRYIRCVNGDGTEMQCGAGLWFDFLEKICKLAEEAMCADGATAPLITTTTPTTTAPTTTTLTTTAPTTTTPTTTALTTTTPTTTTPTTTTPTITTPTTTTPTTTAPTTTTPTTIKTTPGVTNPPLNCPPSGIEDIPHPSDCTRYIRCVNGDPTERACPSGQKFNFPTLRCIAEADAICYN